MKSEHPALRAITYLGAIALMVSVAGWAMILTAPATPSHPIRLHFDGGGSVGDHLKFFSYIETSGVPVQVDGDCVSACTLVLSLPPQQVCIYPYARFGFHLATTDGVDNPEVTQAISDRYYPPRVQEWIKQRGPLKAAPIYMTGEEIIALRVLPACKNS